MHVCVFVRVFSNCSQIVVTCGFEDIRIWNLNDHREVLRITVPNMVCHAVTITVDGKSIISGQYIVVTAAAAAYTEASWSCTSH